MSKFFKIFLVVFSTFSFLLMTSSVIFAEGPCGPGDTCSTDEVCVSGICYRIPTDETQSTGEADPLTDGSGNTADPADTSGGSVSLQDPLGIKDPRDIIENVIKAMLGLVGSLALAVFIYGGFTWVISAGNEEKIKKGKDMIMWAALGLMLIFTSYAIINVVLTAIAG